MKIIHEGQTLDGTPEELAEMVRLIGARTGTEVLEDNIGKYIVFNEDEDGITAGKGYEINGVDEDGYYVFFDDNRDARFRKTYLETFDVLPNNPTPDPRSKFEGVEKVRLVSGGGKHPLNGFDNGRVYDVIDLYPSHHVNRRINIGGGFALPEQLEAVTDEDNIGKYIVFSDVSEYDGTTVGKGYEITDIDCDGDYVFADDDGDRQYGLPTHLGDVYEIVDVLPKKPVPTDDGVYDELEDRVSTMEAQLAELTTESTKRADKETLGRFLSYFPNASDMTFMTKNEQRAKSIEVAREFVEGMQSDEVVLTGPRKVRKRNAEFYVYEEDGIVEAMVNTAGGSRTGIAKCSPADVFNVDIGKANAIARAYEIRVPKEVANAPQPDEAVVGMTVRVEGSRYPYSAKVTDKLGYHHSVDNLRENPQFLIKIIDDSYAVY